MDAGLELIEAQIRECFAKVAWTFTTFQEEINGMFVANKWIFASKTILSALAAGASIVTIKLPTLIDCSKAGGDLAMDIASVTLLICTVAVVALELIFKESGFSDKIAQYTAVTSKLWSVREDYISLLTDIRLPNAKVDIIQKRRDTLQEKLAIIYKDVPRTSNKAYEAATKKLHGEASTLHEDEIDHLLPYALRRNKEHK